MTPLRSDKLTAAGGAHAKSTMRFGWGVFLLILALYLLSANGHLLGQDQEYFYRMARSLARDGSFAVEPLGLREAGSRGVDGRFYAQYAPGLPVALAPFVLVAHHLTGPAASLRPKYLWRHQDEADLAARVLVSYFNVPVTAATAALLALLVVRLGYSVGAGVFAAVAFALATLAWGHARIIFAEPLQGLLLLISYMVLLYATPWRAPLGGAVLALAMLVKLTSVLALPAYLLLPNSRGRSLWRSPATAAGVLVPVLAAGAVHAIYNVARFGSPLTTGYYSSEGGGLDFGGNPLVGLFGLLLSPGRGLVWYAPPVVLTLLVFRRFSGECPATGRVFAILAALWLVAHSFWRDWDGGWGWGPRYLLPILPLLLAPAAAAWRDRRVRLVALGTVALGTLVQLPGASADFMISGRQGVRAFHKQCQSHCGERDFIAWRDFDPAGSEIRWHTGLLLDGKLDLAWMTFDGTWVPPLTLGVATALATAGFALLMVAAGRSPALQTSAGVAHRRGAEPAVPSQGSLTRRQRKRLRRAARSP